ncbi:response regulator [Thermosulfurimonas marina]|uniref:Response regulator n=1 Tax=Thermosulfurimonas marina TaxID=2047767 RepID=A0A6H1WRM3_9BACT|nr:response regulator [Thermosulfurimonas marina]QJA05804.1 response regulator [Thermosulfurimonas marina]
MAQRILLIEDDSDIREQLKEYLGLLAPGSEILTASNVAEAEKLLQEKSFSLVISDCLLPDGLACELLEGISPGTPVIILTGYAEEEALQKVSSVFPGPLYLFKKPISLSEIGKIVQRHLKGV